MKEKALGVQITPHIKCYNMCNLQFGPVAIDAMLSVTTDMQGIPAVLLPWSLKSSHVPAICCGNAEVFCMHGETPFLTICHV